jgi:cell division protein FtsZ
MGSAPAGCLTVAIDTDLARLRAAGAHCQVYLETNLVRGGSNRDPLVAQRAAERAAPQVAEVLAGVDLVVMVCGLGGGTGSGASEVVADIVRATVGARLIGLLILPPADQNPILVDQARFARESLAERVDLVVELPSDLLLRRVGGISEMNRLIASGLLGLLELVLRPSLVNLDLADLTCCMALGRQGLLQAAPLELVPQAEDGFCARLFSDPLWCGRTPQEVRAMLVNIHGGGSLPFGRVTALLDDLSRALPTDCTLLWGYDPAEPGTSPRAFVLATFATGVGQPVGIAPSQGPSQRAGIAS